MDAKQLFFERYDGFREYPEILLDGLTEQQLRRSPHEAVNPIAWILWHITRCEDLSANRLLVDGRQVFESDDWPSRLGWPDRRVGTGMSKAEVEELSERIDLSALMAYRSAVTERTVEVVRALPLEELFEKLRFEHLTQVFVNEGAGGEAAASVIEAYTGQTKGWLLGLLPLTHNYYHISQAFLARAMYGLPRPW